MAAIGVDAVLGEGRYRLERRLGAGGMASVWLARDERLARRVALKVMSDTLADDEHYRERFAREARAAASVSHASIVPVYDYGIHAGRPFLVMEYVPGGSLADVLAGRRSIVLDVVAVARRLLSALDCVHRAGLVHRDVKPANILLDGSGRPCLTDFGIVRPEDATSLTQTGMVIGTLRYLAPEVIAGADAGPAADLYAAGMVLRELAERQPAPAVASLVAALTAADPAERPDCADAALELLAASAPSAPTEPTRVAASTGATAPRVRPLRAARGDAGQAGGPVAARTRRVAGEARARLAARGISPQAAAAAALALLVLVLVAVLAPGGGSSTPAIKGAGGSVPAPSAAPLNDQLVALQALVDQAAKR